MRSRGFSLLEALVTLVIVSLVATVLVQSLLYSLGMRERLLRIDRDSRSAVLHERWFRDSVAAAIGDRPDGLAPFKGSEASLEFLSHSPLVGEGILPVAWRVAEDPEGRRRLEYVQGASTWQILASPLDDAVFEYRDSKDDWHRTWPQKDRPGEAIPRAVRFVAERDGRTLIWMVAVASGPGLPPSLRVAEEVPGADL